MNKRYTDKFLHFQNILFGWPYDIPMAPIWHDRRNEYVWLAIRIGVDHASVVKLRVKKLTRYQPNGNKYFDEVADFLIWWNFHKTNYKGDEEYRERLAQSAYMLSQVFEIESRGSYGLRTVAELTDEYDAEEWKAEIQQREMFFQYLDKFVV